MPMTPVQIAALSLGTVDRTTIHMADRLWWALGGPVVAREVRQPLAVCCLGFVDDAGPDLAQQVIDHLGFDLEQRARSLTAERFQR